MPGRKRHSLPKYTSLGCPLTRNRTGWCFRICTPKKGLGFCGRDAPHALRSRIQLGIDRFKREKAQSQAAARG